MNNAIDECTKAIQNMGKAFAGMSGQSEYTRMRKRYRQAKTIAIIMSVIVCIVSVCVIFESVSLMHKDTELEDLKSQMTVMQGHVKMLEQTLEDVNKGAEE